MQVRPEPWLIAVWCYSYFHYVESLFGFLLSPKDMGQFPWFWLFLSPKMFSKHDLRTAFCFVYPTLCVTAPNISLTRDLCMHRNAKILAATEQTHPNPVFL
jgi:hypothetical protein